MAANKAFSAPIFPVEIGWEAQALAPSSAFPLLRKRIMITAPRQYASKLARLVVERSGRPLWMPTIEVTSMSEEECIPLDESLRSLASFTHLAFTSKNGIFAVVDRLKRICGGTEEACSFVNLAQVRLCALGADAEVLKEKGFPVHVHPEEASTLGLVEELKKLGEVNGAKVLCPVPSVQGGLDEPQVIPRFLNALMKAGADAHRIDSYITRIGSSPEQCHVEKELLMSGGVDAIIFSSTAEAQGLAHLMGSKETICQAVSSHGVIVSAHGPYTAKGAGDYLGLNIECVPKNFSSFAGVVDALEKKMSAH